MTVFTRKLIMGLVLLAFVVPVLTVGSASAHSNNNNFNRHHRHHNNNDDENDHDNTGCLVEIDLPSITIEGFNSEGSRKQKHSYNNDDVTCVTATPTTSVDPTCDQLGFYIIPTTVGVDYTVNGVVVAAGNHTVPNGTTVTIVAVAQQGYAFNLGTTTTWTYTINAPTNCTTATTASVTTSTPPQVKVVPKGGVYAGGGGAQNSSAATFGLITSMTAVAVGLVRKFVA